MSLFDSENCTSTNLITEYGEFKIYVLRDEAHDKETVVLIHGEKSEGCVPLVRIHSECMTGDVFHSLHCDCYMQLKTSLEMIGNSDYGVLIYLRQEGRGIGLFNKIKAYELQRQGLDTIEANVALGLPVDARDYDLAFKILSELGITNIMLITNNPLKINGLEKYGITVGRVPCVIPSNKYDSSYLETKRVAMGHFL